MCCKHLFWLTETIVYIGSICTVLSRPCFNTDNFCRQIFLKIFEVVVSNLSLFFKKEILNLDQWDWSHHFRFYSSFFWHKNSSIANSAAWFGNNDSRFKSCKKILEVICLPHNWSINLISSNYYFNWRDY